jgi:hypothetical protein
LTKDGATIIISKDYNSAIGLGQKDDSIRLVINELFRYNGKKGKVLSLPYTDNSFSKLGLQKDADVISPKHSIAWAHRRTGNADIYFISNQLNREQKAHISFHVKGKDLVMLDPVTGKRAYQYFIRNEGGRSHVEFTLEANQSLFFLFDGKQDPNKMVPFIPPVSKIIPVKAKWNLSFDPKFGGPSGTLTIDELKSWTSFPDSSIKFYSGAASYKNSFTWNESDKKKTLWLQIDSIYNIATIKINDIDCGTLWTPPYLLDITKALKQGENKIEIVVANTWANRLIGDLRLPVEKRITWTNAPLRLANKPLLPAGLVGKVALIVR